MLSCCALALFLANAQSLPPVFTASSVLPANSRTAKPLHPGMLVSIYGQHLGPTKGCTGRPLYDEPIELCGTAVTTGSVKAGLRYVQDDQINLRVPMAVPTEGPVNFVVTVNKRSSAPVPVKFLPRTARIALAAPAYVHMPIRIDVSLPEPFGRNFHYPITIRPADFGGHDFEVRRNGTALPRLQASGAIGGGISSSCGGSAGVETIGMCGPMGLPHQPTNPARLPLHLLYRFDKPGIYEVRYLGYDFRYPMQKNVLLRSAWLQFRVYDYPASRRIQWLADLRRTAPRDPVEILSDFLPSLLAFPDSAVLPVLEDYLYDPDNLVRSYAANALYGFDDNLVAGQMLDLIRRRGPTLPLAYFVAGRKLPEAQAADLVGSILPYLASTQQMLTAGAVKACSLLSAYHHQMRSRMDDAVLKNAAGLMRRHDPDTSMLLAEYQGSVKSDRSRQVLWLLADDQHARDEALTVLIQQADPRDLPRLGKYNDGRRNDDLVRAYGKAATPYLRDARH